MFLPLTPLRCLDRALELFPHREGVVCGERRLTYQEFGDRCGRLASALTLDGVAAGDRVAYLSFNTHRLLEGYFGPLQARAVFMPLNVRLTPAELIQILNHAEARVLFFEADFIPLIEKLRTLCPSIQRYVALDGANPAAHFTYEELLSSGEPERADLLSFDETAMAELFYTSGSTGTPKGVMLSHRTLYMQAMQVLSLLSHEDAIELHTIPLFHANGWSRPQCCTMLGVKHVMVRRFDPPGVFRLIEAERATSMALVPAMAGALLLSPEREKFDLSSLKMIRLGGAASSPELIRRLEQVFRCTALAGYGLTETSPVATDPRPKSGLKYADEAERYTHQAMAGWPIPGVDVRVVDSENRPVPRDRAAIGEIVIRGDNVMDGYYKDPAGTQAVMSNGWLHTGDMAVWDDENFVHIVDRKKDIIISGGENISSIEVEHAIGAHPEIAESAVVAAPDEKWGEVPVAFVLPKPGSAPTEQELIEFLSTRLARFKVPRAWRFVSEPLPKSGTGKVLKRELREQFWKAKPDRVQG